ncbi:hypothetical protein SALBM311S_05605 [Streptomyces alboniger]
MVRARSEAFPAVVALVAVLVSACGAAAPQMSREELFQEYIDSTHVKNDWLGGQGGTSAGRMANFASRGAPTELLSPLLSAPPCDADADFPPSGASRQAVRDFAGSAGSVCERDAILVPADITSVPGEGRVVAVSGHTAMNWQPCLIGTTVAVLVLGAAIGARAARRRTAEVRP